MNITTKDIIKILPLEESLRTGLIQSFDTLTPDQKYNIEKTLWDAYYAIYEITYQKNLRLAFERAKKNQEKLDADFNKRVIEQTENELQNETITVSQDVDLSAARKAMEVIIKEIHAAKAAKKQ